MYRSKRIIENTLALLAVVEIYTNFQDWQIHLRAARQLSPYLQASEQMTGHIFRQVSTTS